MDTILEIELPETFICSNCGELPIDRFTEIETKRRIGSNRNTMMCSECRNKITIKQRTIHNTFSKKYLLPQRWFQYTTKGLEYGLVATMSKTGNTRSSMKIKSKDLWQLYCGHVYLHGRVDAYTGKEFQYFYSDNSINRLNEYMPSLDHILPLSTIGEHELNNVTFITLNLNLRKHNLTLQEYYNKLFLDNGLPETAKPNIDEILGNVSNTYQFYLKHRGTSKIHDIEQYVLDTSPYKHIENEIKGLDLDMGY